MVNHFLFKNRDGQTPLPIELRKGLKLKHIQTIGELDEFEEANIAQGLVWLARYTKDYLNYGFWLLLHKKLFGQVWSWAGVVRKHELNNSNFLLPWAIWPAFKQLEDDLKFWIAGKTYVNLEIAARLHERLLTIHPFANGNGRFARIATEHFCQRQKMTAPSWGSTQEKFPVQRRASYINAIEEARHKKNPQPLMDFMTS